MILAAPHSGKKGLHTMLYHQLTQEERYLISRSSGSGMGVRDIARLSGRSPSTVSRELRRNATAHDGNYRAEKAHSYAVARRRRSRRGSQFSNAVHQAVDSAIRQRWSPEQIVGTFRARGKPTPSVETIYRRIRKDKRAGGTLFRFTRIMSKVGRKRYRSRPARGVLLGKRHISERPKAVEQRKRLGDWEVDTVMGRGSKHCLLTMVERKSGFTLIRKLRARTAAEATAAVGHVIKRHRSRVRTITFDNGTEFHDYETLERRFRITCYFATPYHSWERGTNENLNGLVRQYLPKGTCLKRTTQEQCNQIAQAINNRPRKRHAYQTPKSIYNQSL